MGYYDVLEQIPSAKKRAQKKEVKWHYTENVANYPNTYVAVTVKKRIYHFKGKKKKL